MPDTSPNNGKLLARIDERTAHIMKTQEAYHQELCDKLNDHEKRIRNLERNTWWRDGAAALTGAVAGLLAGLKT